MARKTKKKKSTESDGTYYFKIVLYLIIGSLWLWIVDFDSAKQIPIPVGFIAGMFFASHEHFQIDRKIEYAMLTVGMFIGFWVGTGLRISF